MNKSHMSDEEKEAFNAWGLRLEKRLKTLEDKVENLEKEVKALYSGLHGAVGKEFSGYIKRDESLDFEDKTTPPCEHEWFPVRSSEIRNYAFEITRYDCNKCGQSKPVDKPTQTLAEKLICDNWSVGSLGEASRRLAKIAQDHYTPLLQSEYQRGKEDGHDMGWNQALKQDKLSIEIGRKKAIEEMKEKFNNIVLRISAQYGDRSAMLHHLKRELFTESK